MKRSGMPRRKTRLKSNAASQREWEDRTRRRRLNDPDHAPVVSEQRAVARRRASAYQEARECRARMADGYCEANWEGVCPPGRHYGQTAHHVRRRSQGGPDTVENLRWICGKVHDHIHFVDLAGAVERGLIDRAARIPRGKVVGDDA